MVTLHVSDNACNRQSVSGDRERVTRYGSTAGFANTPSDCAAPPTSSKQPKQSLYKAQVVLQPESGRQLRRTINQKRSAWNSVESVTASPTTETGFTV
jgi:hypothetical protein